MPSPILAIVPCPVWKPQYPSATRTHSSRKKLNARFAFLITVRAISLIPFFSSCLIVGALQRAGFLLKSRDIQVDKPVETCVLVYWHTEATRHFQRDKAMNKAAHAAHGVNSVFLAESVWREHGPDNIYEMLRDGLQLLVARIGRLQREGIAPGCFPGVVPVG